jgi:hypothetical protein
MANHISRQELIAYRKKELDPKRSFEIRCHLDVCEECFEEFDALSVGSFFEPYVRHLHNTEGPSSHPSEETIKDFWKGTIDKETKDAILDHLLLCTQCDAKFHEIMKETSSKELSQKRSSEPLSKRSTADLSILFVREVGNRLINKHFKSSPRVSPYMVIEDRKIKTIDKKRHRSRIRRNKPTNILRSKVDKRRNCVIIKIHAPIPNSSQKCLVSLRIGEKTYQPSAINRDTLYFKIPLDVYMKGLPFELVNS